MSDEADKAQALSDLFLRESLSNCKRRIKIENSGFCLNCLEPVYHGNYCDSDCRDDWVKRNG